MALSRALSLIAKRRRATAHVTLPALFAVVARAVASLNLLAGTSATFLARVKDRVGGGEIYARRSEERRECESHFGNEMCTAVSRSF